MQVGIDGGALSISDDRLKVGVYRVAYNLIKELGALDVKHNYRVYTFRGVGQGNVPTKSNRVTYVPLIGTGYRKLWQPVEMMQNKIHAYLGISQAFPLTLYDVTKIGFIYDIGFLEHPEYYRESYFALANQTADIVRRSHHIITISNASRDSIHSTYHVPLHKITVAYLGIEKQFTPTGPKHKRTHPYFLFVGALKPGKNVPMMLRAFARFLTKSKQPYDLVLAGSDYWLDPGISATINALSLQKRVHRVGFVDDETLATYYRGAVALLTVSLIEGFGLPSVEAMACGCPVIASTAGSFPEVVGSNGIMVNPEDEVSLAHAMYDVATNKRLREEMSEKGIQASKKYDWKRFAETVHDVITTTRA